MIGDRGDQLSHLPDDDRRGVDLARRSLPVGRGQARLEASSLRPGFYDRDVVAFGLLQGLVPLPVAPGEIRRRRLSQASTQLNERNQELLTIALERPGKRTRPRRRHRLNLSTGPVG
jgi:hypothetical protein